MNNEIKLEAKQPPWECAARKQGTAGGNEPADCDWPLCQCDPYANKVITALDEAGFELTKKQTVDKLRSRVAALELIIAEDLRPVECGDELNKLLVEQIHERHRATVSPS